MELNEDQMVMPRSLSAKSENRQPVLGVLALWDAQTNIPVEVMLGALNNVNWLKSLVYLQNEVPLITRARAVDPVPFLIPAGVAYFEEPTLHPKTLQDMKKKAKNVVNILEGLIQMLRDLQHEQARRRNVKITYSVVVLIDDRQSIDQSLLDKARELIDELDATVVVRYYDIDQQSWMRHSLELRLTQNTFEPEAVEGTPTPVDPAQLLSSDDDDIMHTGRYPMG